jgi:hypothetical protein
MAAPVAVEADSRALLATSRPPPDCGTRCCAPESGIHAVSTDKRQAANDGEVEGHYRQCEEGCHQRGSNSEKVERQRPLAEDFRRYRDREVRDT